MEGMLFVEGLLALPFKAFSTLVMRDFLGETYDATLRNHA